MNSKLPIIKAGFTLIELMAVVAIITILAAIMIPNVAKHVERGRMARVEADMDVLIKAISLFQIDHEGDLPKTENLSELWSDPKGPYISSDDKMETPWKGRYIFNPGTTSYKISATDKNGNEKLSKTINF